MHDTRRKLVLLVEFRREVPNKTLPFFQNVSGFVQPQKLDFAQTVHFASFRAENLDGEITPGTKCRFPGCAKRTAVIPHIQLNVAKQLGVPNLKCY